MATFLVRPDDADDPLPDLDSATDDTPQRDPDADIEALCERLEARPRIGQRVEVLSGLWRGLRGRIQAVSPAGQLLDVMFSDGEIVCLSTMDVWPLEA